MSLVQIRKQNDILKPTHLHGIHRLGLTDHAQVVLLGALHLVLSVLPHRPRQPLPIRPSRLGSHRGHAHRPVRLRVALLAVFVAVEGSLALSAFDQVVAVLPALEALEDVDPHGLATRLFHRLLVQRWVVVGDVRVVGCGVGGGVVVDARGSV